MRGHPWVCTFKMIRKVQVIVYTRTPDVAVLLLRRPPEHGHIWQPVTGKLEPDDPGFAEGARRELLEETGIDAAGRVIETDLEFRFQGEGSGHRRTGDRSGTCRTTPGPGFRRNTWNTPGCRRLRLSTGSTGTSTRRACGRCWTLRSGTLEAQFGDGDRILAWHKLNDLGRENSVSLPQLAPSQGVRSGERSKP